MLSEKRRLAQIGRENAKVAKTNRAISSYFQCSEEKHRQTGSVVQDAQISETSGPSPTVTDSMSQLVQMSSEKDSCSQASTQTPTKQAADSKAPTQRRKLGGHKVGFNVEWGKGRPWLIHKVELSDDESVSVLYCKLCQQYGSGGLNGSRTWVDTGCKTVRLDKVKDHENSAQHRHALSLSLSETVDTMSDKVTSAAQGAILDALKVLQYIIQHNLPLDLFSSLTDLCIEVGSPTLANLRLAKNANYTSWDIVSELLELLSNEIKEEVRSNIQASPCFSTMVDEVCDMTIEKHLAVCCKFVNKNGDQQTAFMTDIPLKSATADAVTSAITDEVQRHGLSLNNMTGFASDGAAVFVGKNNGVATQLKKQHPGLVNVHCKDHRLALACRDSFCNVPLFKETDKMLEDTYRYYKNSLKKTTSLKDVQISFRDAPLTIKQAKHHRWLSHDKAVSSIVRSYRSLVVDLETSTVSEDPVGNGLLKSYKNPVNLHILLLLADVLPHLSALSLFFQRKDLHLGMVQANVDKTIRVLEKRKSEDSTWLQKAATIMHECDIKCDDSSLTKFYKVRVQFLTELTDNISRRFSDSNIVEALSVLDLSVMVEIPEFHGDSEMDTLASHFSMDSDELVQWQGFTELIRTMQVENRSLGNLAKFFFGKDHVSKGLEIQFPLVARLVAIAVTLPLSTAEVERVFSQLKMIKTDHRCALKAKTVDMLLNVKLNGSSEAFDRVRPAVVKHFFKTNRRLC